MRLRGRFTLWFAAATLVPIAVAAIVTRFVLVRSARETYQATRVGVEQAARLEVQRLSEDVEAAVRAMADREYPLVGGLLRELVKEGAASAPPRSRPRRARRRRRWTASGSMS